jgi:uncharacterized membrane protein YuzA (DUF378 family)
VSTFNEQQQRAFVDDQWIWGALPAWVKAVSLLVGAPVFLAMIYLTIAGEDSKSSTFIYLFVAFAAVALLQIVFALRAFRKLGRDG